MKEEYADLLARIDKQRLPQHIAVILDGNGRWAAQHDLPRTAGHKAGVEAVRRLAEICRELGVLSYLYTFQNDLQALSWAFVLGGIGLKEALVDCS